MSLDNSQATSAEPGNSELTVNDAVAAFAEFLEPTPEEPDKEKEQEAPQAEAEAEPVEAVEEEAKEEDPLVTVKIDGQEVQIPLSELKNGYQRQADYTRKTMEVAETRKAAEAERAQAQQERMQYAAKLQQAAAQLEGALEQQKQIDWQRLIEENPQEALRQQHLMQTRQAQLQQAYAEQSRIAQLEQAERQEAYQSYLQQQQEALLAKLPDWKDEAKAKAEKVALRDYLQQQGYQAQEIDGVADSRAVVMARKAMLYDQMISKAQAATKKVSTLPTKVEKPGVGENPNLDRRTSAYQNLKKSGKVEDAAALFAQFL